MKLISHRGNILGPDLENENSLPYINTALNKGYDIEVDVWFLENQWYLGHDFPKYAITLEFLLNTRIWCHAKNNLALTNMMEFNVPNYFWHETDKFTLTSSGYIWTYPGNEVGKRSIEVIQDNSIPNKEVYGVCSDFVGRYE